MGRALFLSLILALVAEAATGVRPTFNRVQGEYYMDPYRGYSRMGRDIEAELIGHIDSARRRLWVAAYELRLPKLARALRAAKERGVDVRLVTEHQNNFEFSNLKPDIEKFVAEDDPKPTDYETSRLKDYFAYADLNKNNILEDSELDEMDAMRIVKEAGIPIIDDTADGTKGSGLMHHKFVVIDNTLTFSGSGNFTWSDFHGDKLKEKSLGNANNFFVIESQVINKAFADEFAIMWGGGPNGSPHSRFGVKKPYRAPLTTQLRDGSKVTIQFGGTSKAYGWESSPNGLIGQHISQIKESLQAAFFVWSEQRHADLLPRELAANIEILLDPFFGYRSYSELLDIFGVEMFSDTCKLERENNLWTTPALGSGVVELTEGDLLHHKFAVLDSQKVITGSHNWSANANTNNDEVVLVIESPSIASRYQDEFKRLKARSKLGLSPQLVQKIEDSQHACQ